MAKLLNEGDSVTIKSKDWYDKSKNKDGDVRFAPPNEPFIRQMSQFCGKTARIVRVTHPEEGLFEIDLDRGRFYWSVLMTEN